MPQVSVLEMTKENIDTRNKALKLKEVFAEAPAIKEIARFHYLTIEDGHRMPFVTTNDAVEISHKSNLPSDVANTDRIEEEPIKVGDWWAVEYDEGIFPGEAKQICDRNYEVSIMHRAGTTWKWPPSEDKIF